MIKGFEIATSSKNDEKYLLKLAQIAYNEGYIINLHSPTFNTDEDAKKYLHFAVRISKIVKRKINIVYHPINGTNIYTSKKITKQNISKLLRYIEENNYLENIELSIENLNNINDIKRLKKDDLIEILKEEKKLKFTYDIGHEMIDGINTKDFHKTLLEKLNNIHIHTFYKNLDHYPIKSFNIENTKKIKDILEKIIKYGYDGNIVMEYAIDYIEGENFEKKLENYIKSAQILNCIFQNFKKS